MSDNTDSTIKKSNLQKKSNRKRIRMIIFKSILGLCLIGALLIIVDKIIAIISVFNDHGWDFSCNYNIEEINWSIFLIYCLGLSAFALIKTIFFKQESKWLLFYLLASIFFEIFYNFLYGVFTDGDLFHRMFHSFYMSLYLIVICSLILGFVYQLFLKKKNKIKMYIYVVLLLFILTYMYFGKRRFSGTICEQDGGYYMYTDFSNYYKNDLGEIDVTAYAGKTIIFKQISYDGLKIGESVRYDENGNKVFEFKDGKCVRYDKNGNIIDDLTQEMCDDFMEGKIRFPPFNSYRLDGRYCILEDGSRNCILKIEE